MALKKLFLTANFGTAWTGQTVNVTVLSMQYFGWAYAAYYDGQGHPMEFWKAFGPTGLQLMQETFDPDYQSSGIYVGVIQVDDDLEGFVLYSIPGAPILVERISQVVSNSPQQDRVLQALVPVNTYGGEYLQQNVNGKPMRITYPTVADEYEDFTYEFPQYVAETYRIQVYTTTNHNATHQDDTVGPDVLTGQPSGWIWNDGAGPYDVKVTDLAAPSNPVWFLWADRTRTVLSTTTPSVTIPTPPTVQQIHDGLISTPNRMAPDANGAIAANNIPAIPVPPTTQQIHDALFTNTNKLAPDAQGGIAANNLPAALSNGTMLADLVAAVNDLNVLLARPDVAGAVGGIQTAIVSLQDAISQVQQQTDKMNFSGENIKADAVSLPSPAPPGYGSTVIDFEAAGGG